MRTLPTWRSTARRFGFSLLSCVSVLAIPSALAQSPRDTTQHQTTQPPQDTTRQTSIQASSDTTLHKTVVTTGRRNVPVDTLKIDATQGDVSGGGMRVSTQHDILLLVQNVNPFIHRYRILGTTTTYTENAIGAFATALGLPVTVPAAPSGLALSVSNGGGGAGSFFTSNVPLSTTPRPICGALVAAAVREEAGAQWAAIDSLNQATVARGKRLHDSLSALRDAMDAGGKGRVAADSLKDGALTSEAILLRVRRLRPSIHEKISAIAQQAAALGPSVTGYNSMIATLYTETSKLAEKYPACEVFAMARTRAATWVSDTVSYRAIVTAAVAQVTELSSIRDALASVERSPEATRMQRTFGNYDEPTVVELVVQRSPTGPDTIWRSIATPRLTFGSRRRFAIGVGGLESSVSVSTYEIATRYRQPAPGQPGDTTERVIVESGSSRARLTPAIVLSARMQTLPYPWLDGVHLSFGTAPRESGSKTTLDYLAGLGFSAADQRILLTIGGASVEQTKLADTYKVNDKVPATQTTVPTRKTRLFKPAFAVTFRVF